MTILCGVDFSQASQAATRVAAALAQRSRERLLLVHATESEPVRDPSSQALLALEQERLASRAGPLREQGVEVETLVAPGVPDEVLLEAARQHAARCIVVGALGYRQRGAELGSHADRLAHEAHVPVLVVRDAGPFEAWARGERPLKVLLGVDLSPSTPPAAEWARQLARIGPCEVTAAYLYWPPTEWARLGLSGMRDILKPEPEVTRLLENNFEQYRQAFSEAARFELRMEPNLGSIGAHLAELASKLEADLIVVGSRARGMLRRWWEGSVSRTTLEVAPVSVACVPATAGAPVLVAGASPPSVLVATDFSPIGNAAIETAYDAVHAGGTVHLIHVTARIGGDVLAPHDIFGDGPGKAALRERLAALVPARPGSAAKTEVHVLDADDRADAICQAAERLGVDAIVLGTHGRSGISRAVLGSIAASVLQRTKRRVILVRPALP